MATPLPWLQTGRPWFPKLLLKQLCGSAHNSCALDLPAATCPVTPLLGQIQAHSLEFMMQLLEALPVTGLWEQRVGLEVPLQQPYRDTVRLACRHGCMRNNGPVSTSLMEDAALLPPDCAGQMEAQLRLSSQRHCLPHARGWWVPNIVHASSATPSVTALHSPLLSSLQRLACPSQLAASF